MSHRPPACLAARICTKSLVLLPLCASACRDSAEVRARILDERGRPVAGAILYVECDSGAGATDFQFAVASRDGVIPADGATPLVYRAERGAKLTLAALAPGKKPTVLYDHAGRIQPDGLTLVLKDLARPGERWEPRIGMLTYPFEGHPELAARLRRPEYSELRRAFVQTYEILKDPRENALPRELEKWELIKGLRVD